MRYHALKYLVRLRYGDALAADARNEAGEVRVYGSGGAHGRHDEANTSGPAIIVGRKGSVGALHWSGDPVWVADTAYVIDRVQRPGSLRFVYYFLSQAALGDMSQDVGVPGLSREAVHSLPCPDWSKKRQAMIADFLDRECERIAAASTSAESVDAAAMSGLAEERERIYLDDARPTRLTAVLAEPPRYGVLVPSLQDEGVPFIRVGNLDRLRNGLSTVTARIPPSQAVEYRRTTVRAGDVLVSVVGSIDKSAIVPEDLVGANVARAVAVLRPGTMTAMLVWGWTRTRAYRDQALLATSADTAQPTLNMGDLATFRIGVPVDPVAAQRRLERVETLVARVSTGARRLRLALREYRDALIHEAITGKLSVSQVSEAQMDERLHAATENRLDEVA